MAEDERRERFSFALASALGLSTQAQQSLLYSQASVRFVPVIQKASRIAVARLLAFNQGFPSS